MKVKSLLQVLVLMMFICVPVFSIAQIGDFDPGGDPDVPVPFDGGISLLLAAGIGYGVKKAYEKRKTVGQATDVVED